MRPAFIIVDIPPEFAPGVRVHGMQGVGSEHSIRSGFIEKPSDETIDVFWMR